MTNQVSKDITEKLKGIVNSQTQVRTNKLKPIIRELEESLEVEAVIDPQVTYNPYDEDNKRLGEKMRQLLGESGIDYERLSDELEDAVLALKENRYLKRKLTMYDLRIAKQDKTIRELKAEKKEERSGEK